MCRFGTHRETRLNVSFWHKIPTHARDTFYLDLQSDEAMSGVLTESQCSGDEREIEWTIPGIGLSTNFSKALVINRDNWVGEPF